MAIDLVDHVPAEPSKTTHRPAGTVYELVITHGKGYGLFASESIPRGTRVLEESPLMAMPSSAKHGLPAMDVQDLAQTLGNLSPDQHEAYFELYHDPRAAARASKWIRQEQEQYKHAKPSPPFPDAHKVEAMVKLHAIYQTNVVRLGDGPTSGTGVFPLTSRINHSCVPNLQIHYIPSIERLVVHAVRHVNKGEELTINYHPNVCRTRKQRNDVLVRRWGFECQCKVCTGLQAASSEVRRKMMLGIDYDLTAYEEPELFAQRRSPPQTPQDAASMAENLLDLIKAEGIADRGLQDAYRRCSKCCLKARLLDKAIAHAKKERDIERYCIGPDVARMPHLEADLRGAEFWLEHVLKRAAGAP